MISIVNDIIHHIVNYSMLNFIIFGAIGNFMCFRIFTLTKLNKYPISIYFRAISIFDSVMLIHGVHFYIRDNSTFNMKYVDSILCKMWPYFLYAIGPISGWLMVIVSLDRFLSIMFPRRFPLIHKSSFQLAIIFSIVVCNYVLYSSMIWRSEFQSVSNGTNKCVQYFNIDSSIYLIDLINSALLPFLIMFFMSISLITFVHRSRSRSRSNNSSSSSKRDIKFAITVVSLNIMFFVLNLPICISNLPFLSLGSSFGDISAAFYYASYSLGFYVQFLVNSDFRHEFLRMVKIKVNDVSSTEMGRTSNYNLSTINNRI